MSSTKQRIAQCTQIVKAAGLKGEDMTSALTKLAEQHELNGNEIRRIAEIANRDVQLEMYKVAGDKRFTFKLADGLKVAEAAKLASVKLERENALLAAVKQAGGDPFAAPVRYLDLPENAIPAELVDSRDRAKIAELDKARLELETLIKHAQADEVTTVSQAYQDHDHALESAMGLIQSGVTLPSLFESILAAVSGDRDRAEAIRYADSLITLIISGLRAKGVPNFKMGFRHRGRPDLLEQLTPSDLVVLCHRASAYCAGEPDLSMAEAKSAERLMETIVDGGPSAGSVDGPSDAENWLKNRGSQNGIYKVPQAYLGDIADNMPNGKVRVVNANHEFVVSINNLVGDQMRLVKNHDAQEYLGLKLQQIEHAIRKLQQIRQGEADKQKAVNEKLVPDQQKQANPLLAAGARALSSPALMNGLMATSMVAPMLQRAPKQPAQPTAPSAHI